MCDLVHVSMKSSINLLKKKKKKTQLSGVNSSVFPWWMVPKQDQKNTENYYVRRWLLNPFSQSVDLWLYTHVNIGGFQTFTDSCLLCNTAGTEGSSGKNVIFVPQVLFCRSAGTCYGTSVCKLWHRNCTHNQNLFSNTGIHMGKGEFQNVRLK